MAFSAGVKANGMPDQGCQIFLDTNIPNWENITNDHKQYQTAINYTKWP
jgi:hypothetical protein